MSVEIFAPEDVPTEGHVVFIFAGDHELDVLIDQLKALRDGEYCSDTITLFSESWGNGALSEKKQIEESKITHCLKIQRRNSE